MRDYQDEMELIPRGGGLSLEFVGWRAISFSRSFRCDLIPHASPESSSSLSTLEINVSAQLNAWFVLILYCDGGALIAVDIFYASRGIIARVE